MKQVEVLLNAPERALRFCNILSACEGPFDLGRGSYTVDGKSILGICTMDLTVPLTLPSMMRRKMCWKKSGSFWCKFRMRRRVFLSIKTVSVRMRAVLPCG